MPIEQTKESNLLFLLKLLIDDCCLKKMVPKYDEKVAKKHRESHDENHNILRDDRIGKQRYAKVTHCCCYIY